MEKLKEIIKKYLQRMSNIEERYIRNGVFVCDEDTTEEELAIIEKEYQILKSIVESLNSILKEFITK